ncbi:DUF58 domain-containing protein [Akkermansiaceae bacterium]|nr:DUF58 domain-containing protein [Akkermansiaceae bacterium]MDB4452496.1 DUF58 domain-containing protein [Akkermansiaceae bacterium]MDB4667917.1 DUF58 domain-containing protein [Akkermansiaceae bacterium]MDB4800421.1 DUF58 domain-containing protein [bacterium]
MSDESGTLKMPECMRLLTAQTMAAMKRLEWLSRRRMQGTLSGRHTSPDKGVSVEFAEHREYTPGDDTKNLDWRVMGKSDRNVVKQFIQETNLRANIVLDISGSMSFKGEQSEKSKFEYGCELAAALAYLFVKQGDAAGLVTFDDKVQKLMRAESRPSQVRRICEILHGSEPGGETGVGEVLHEVAERVPGRGLVILISDLFDDPKKITEALHHFNYRQHDLVVFHLLAEEELSFPFQQFQRFKDLEGVEKMLRIDPQAMRAAYLEKLREFIATIEGVCGNLRADYVPVTTKTDLPETLTRYLGSRRI